MPVPLVPTAARRRPGVLALGLALLLAACGGGPGPVGSTFSPIPPGDGSPSPSGVTVVPPSASPPTATPGLLLEVTTEGGFINPAATIGALPLVAVDAAGRIFTPATAPGAPGLIPAVDVRDTGAAGAAAIRAAIRAAGLEGPIAGGGVVADAGTVVFTAVVDGAEVVNRVSGAGPGVPTGGQGQPGSSGGASGSSAAALALLARLTDVTQAWGSPTPPVVARFAPTAYRAWIAPAADDPAAASIAWPLAGEPSAFGTPAAADLGLTGLRSGIVSGKDAAALGAALATAAPGTLLSAAGGPWRVWVRPLLPDETGG